MTSIAVSTTVVAARRQITSLRHSLQANMDGDIAIGTIKRAANEATTLGREASKLREATLELDRYLAASDANTDKQQVQGQR